MYLPQQLELDIYRSLYTDLKKMTDEQLMNHYELHGKTEGRVANRLKDRNDFAKLIDTSLLKTLEIGPFASPMIKGSNTYYADHLNQDELKKRAHLLGLNPENVPTIHYHLLEKPLEKINDSFDIVLSSHCIEHQPDLVKHLLDIEKLIKERDGKYFLLIPDKRYCFDHFLSESTIADILDAHFNNHTVHSLKSVIEHRALTTHNNTNEHWQENSNFERVISAQAIHGAINEWRNVNGAYIDVHAWYFTPSSFIANINLLKSLGLINLSVERIYPTRYGSNEFWVVLSLLSEPVTKHYKSMHHMETSNYQVSYFSSMKEIIKKIIK